MQNIIIIKKTKVQGLKAFAFSVVTLMMNIQNLDSKEI